MIFRKFIISKNELCPCGSKKKYKECCFGKKALKIKNIKQLNAVIGKEQRKSRVKTCLYPKCKAKAKEIILAHAMQENKILSKLCVEKQILMQNVKSDPTYIEMKKGKLEPFYFLELINIKNATVYTCFCAKHDNKLFEKIEKDSYPFSIDNKEQIFLFTYKTFAFEYYKEIINCRFYENICKQIPQIYKNPLWVRQYREGILKRLEMDYYQEIFNRSLMDKDYNGFESIIIELPEQIQFATYMCVAPPFDLNGKKINIIDKESKMMRRVFVTIFPEDKKSYIIISCHKNDLHIYNTYLDTIKKSDIEIVKYYLNVFIPLYTENLIISPNLWDKWDEQGQMAVQYAVSETRVAPILKALQFHLKNISKNPNTIISTKNISFDFFA